MDVQTIAVVATVLGILATATFVGMGAAGIKLLRDIRDKQWERRNAH